MDFSDQPWDVGQIKSLPFLGSLSLFVKHICSFIHSFIQEILMEFLLCARDRR